MGWVVNATPRPFDPRERPGTQCIGGWVGPRAGLNECGKSRFQTGFDPRAVQPIASRYTDWAIPTHEDIVTTPNFFYCLYFYIRITFNSTVTVIILDANFMDVREVSLTKTKRYIV